MFRPLLVVALLALAMVAHGASYQGDCGAAQTGAKFLAGVYGVRVLSEGCELLEAGETWGAFHEPDMTFPQVWCVRMFVEPDPLTFLNYDRSVTMAYFERQGAGWTLVVRLGNGASTESGGALHASELEMVVTYFEALPTWIVCSAALR
jgi:hypothetical protein